MKDIYLEVSARLSQKVPEIRLIDLDSGQIDAQGAQYPTDFPLALVRISIRAADSTRTEQKRDVRIDVRLAWEAWTSETSSITPAQWKGRALAKMELVDKVIDALQGWGGSFFDYLTFISATPDRRADGLMVYTLSFETSYECEAE